MPSAKRFLDEWFHLSERGSTLSTEMRAGFCTFLTMSYILLVNPQILSTAGLPIKEVVSSTALTSCLATLFVGIFANQPVGVSPGMGLNCFLVYSQVLGSKASVELALGCCFAAAVIVAVLALVRALSFILALVPNAIKLAVVVGMGLLLSFIGLQTAHVVVRDEETMVKLGQLGSAEVLLSMFGLTLIASLHHKQVPGSIIIGIIATALGYFAVKSSWPHTFMAFPQLGFWKLEFGPILAMEPEVLSAVGAYTLVMIFDIGGAMYGLGNLAGIVKDGHVPGAIATYLGAAAGTALGALTGTSPLIIAAESAVGIKEGGRTGLTAITVSACFAISLFFAPILQAVPAVATAPVLVLVGTMMMGEAGHINWTSMPTALPAFLTMVIQPFTFSIANGVYAGLLFSFLLYITTGEFITHIRSLLQSSDEGVADLCEVGYGTGQALAEPLLPHHGAHTAHTPTQPMSARQSLSHHVHQQSSATDIVRSVGRRIMDDISNSYYERNNELLIGTPTRMSLQHGIHPGHYASSVDGSNPDGSTRGGQQYRNAGL